MILEALLLLLAPAQTDVIREYQAAYDDAFEKEFRSSFRTNGIESCVSAAKISAAAGINMTPICSCVIDQLLATKSVDELKQPIEIDSFRALTAECIRTHSPRAATARP